MRQARPSDAPAVAALIAQAARTGFALVEPEEVDERGIALDLAEGLGLRVVAERAGEVAGYLSIVPGQTHALSRTGDLQMVVSREHQGRGIGAELLRRAISWAEGGALDRIEIFVRAHNGRALSLYKRFGFVEEGLLKRRFLLANGEKVDDLLLARVFEGPLFS